MSDTPDIPEETLIKERLIKEDGRYLISYRFEPVVVSTGPYRQDPAGV